MQIHIFPSIVEFCLVSHTYSRLWSTHGDTHLNLERGLIHKSWSDIATLCTKPLLRYQISKFMTYDRVTWEPWMLIWDPFLVRRTQYRRFCATLQTARGHNKKTNNDIIAGCTPKFSWGGKKKKKKTPQRLNKVKDSLTPRVERTAGPLSHALW